MTREDISMVNSYFSYAVKLCGDHHNAQDIIQDIFLRILSSPEKFESLETGEKKQYVVRSVHNRCIDRHRRTLSKGRVKYHVPVEESKAAIKPDVYAKMELKEVMNKGRKYRHFDTLMMQVHGFTSYEISAMTETNLNTVLGKFRYTRIYLKK